MGTRDMTRIAFAETTSTTTQTRGQFLVQHHFAVESELLNFRNRFFFTLHLLSSAVG